MNSFQEMFNVLTHYSPQKPTRRDGQNGNFYPHFKDGKTEAQPGPECYTLHQLAVLRWGPRTLLSLQKNLYRNIFLPLFLFLT